MCEVHLPKDQILAPRLQSKLTDKGEFILPAFDDMWPHLPRDEYARARSLDHEASNGMGDRDLVHDAVV